MCWGWWKVGDKFMCVYLAVFKAILFSTSSIAHTYNRRNGGEGNGRKKQANQFNAFQPLFY